MSTSSLRHHLAPTAAAAVLAIALSGLGLALARTTGGTGAPTDAPQQPVTQTHHGAPPSHPTVSGGRVRVGP